jgi:hypothetical protein
MDSQGNEGTQNKPIVIDEKVKKSPRVHIDLTAFDETNDAILEKELAEIALNGRITTYSTTNSDRTRDLENGNERYSQDEADRPSWGKVANKHRNRSGLMKTANKKKMYLVAILVVIIATIIGVVCGFLLNKLNDRQEAIDKIISGITDPNLFKQSSTPQAQAREWILFDDKEIYDLDESLVIQKFVLALFYFGTGGTAVWGNTNWLKGNECAKDNEWIGLDCNSKGKVRTIFQGKAFLS